MPSFSQVAIVSKKQFKQQYKLDLNNKQKAIVKKVLKYHNDLNDLANWAVFSLKVNKCNDSSHDSLPSSLQVRWYDDKVLFGGKVNSIFSHFLLKRLGSSEKSYETKIMKPML